MYFLLGAALAGSFPTHDSPFKSGTRSPDDAAVVIGIEDYFVLPDVPHAERDASAVEDLLIYTIGVPTDRVERVAAPASKERIEEALERAKGLVGPDGTLWVYFAGHGAASPSTGDRVLLGADTLADASSFEARSIAIPDLKGRIHGAGARTVLMVDACYSGASRGGSELLPGKRFAVPSYAVPDEAGWIEWHAAQPDQMSGPLEVAEHGAFTWAMIGALRGWADGQIDDQPDGQVTVEEADLYVRELLRSVEVRDQQPALNASDVQTVLHAGERFEARPDSSALRELSSAVPAATEPPADQAAAVAPAPAPAPVPAPIQRAPFQPTAADKVAKCKKKGWRAPDSYPSDTEAWMCAGQNAYVTDSAHFSAEDAQAATLAHPRISVEDHGSKDWTLDGVPITAFWVDARHPGSPAVYFDDPRTSTTYSCFILDVSEAEWKCRDTIAPLIEHRLEAVGGAQ